MFCFMKYECGLSFFFLDFFLRAEMRNLNSEFSPQRAWRRAEEKQPTSSLKTSITTQL